MANFWARLSDGKVLMDGGGARVRTPLFVRFIVNLPGSVKEIDYVRSRMEPTSYVHFSLLGQNLLQNLKLRDQATLSMAQFDAVCQTQPESGFTDVSGYRVPTALNYSSRAPEFAKFKEWCVAVDKWAELDHVGDQKRVKALAAKPGTVARKMLEDAADAAEVANALQLAVLDDEAEMKFSAYSALRTPEAAAAHAVADLEWRSRVRKNLATGARGTSSQGVRGKFGSLL